MKVQCIFATDFARSRLFGWQCCRLGIVLPAATLGRHRVRLTTVSVVEVGDKERV